MLSMVRPGKKSICWGTIGQLLCGEITGRTSAQDVTVFNTLGLAIEDIACAKYLYLAGKGEN